MVLAPFGCSLMTVTCLPLSSTNPLLTTCRAAVPLAAVARATHREDAAAPPASNMNDNVNYLGHAAVSPARLAPTNVRGPSIRSGFLPPSTLIFESSYALAVAYDHVDLHRRITVEKSHQRNLRPGGRIRTRRRALWNTQDQVVVSGGW